MRTAADEETPGQGVSRRSFLGAGSTALATAAFSALSARAQAQLAAQKGGDSSQATDPGQVNKRLREENPNTDMPPATDHGDLGPIWYSFDLAHKRVERGGWTHEVTQRQLPPSRDVAGVNMRLNAGAFRELHWHTADEWAFMLYGTARITVLNPDGTIFIDDVGKGDLWFFPAGYPHSIQGLGLDGCEFLLVFNDGSFSEENTFLLSEWVAHTPPEILKKNFRLEKDAIEKLPARELFIFPADLPRSLSEDKTAVGGSDAQSPVHYTFKMLAMEPTKSTAGGEVRIVDSKNFPPSLSIAAGLVTLKPGALRELHWHPNGSEWQFWIEGRGRMTVFGPPGRARTMDFNANDVGFVPTMAGHCIENTGTTDLMFLEIIRAPEFKDFSLNNWLRHLPPEMVAAHLNLDESEIRKVPIDKQLILAK
jgi:oxalate decarboxylase